MEAAGSLNQVPTQNGAGAKQRSCELNAYRKKEYK